MPPPTREASDGRRKASAARGKDATIRPLLITITLYDPHHAVKYKKEKAPRRGGAPHFRLRFNVLLSGFALQTDINTPKFP